MIIDHQDFGLGRDLGVVEADGLDGEIDAVVVVECGHADGEKTLRPARRGRRGVGGAGRKQMAIEQLGGALETGATKARPVPEFQ